MRSWGARIEPLHIQIYRRTPDAKAVHGARLQISSTPGRLALAAGRVADRRTGGWRPGAGQDPQYRPGEGAGVGPASGRRHPAPRPHADPAGRARSHVPSGASIDGQSRSRPCGVALTPPAVCPVAVPSGRGLTLAAQSGLLDIVLGGHGALPPDFWVFPMRSVHYAISRLLMAAIALHVAAALYHTFILRDGLLRRMWFGKRLEPEIETARHGGKHG
jgi:hypothetical protein